MAKARLNWFETEAFGSHANCANCANCHRLRSADMLFQPNRFRVFVGSRSFFGAIIYVKKTEDGWGFFEEMCSCYMSKF